MAAPQRGSPAVARGLRRLFRNDPARTGSALCDLVFKYGPIAIAATETAVAADAKSTKYIEKVCGTLAADADKNPMCLPRKHLGFGHRPGDRWTQNGRELWWPKEDPRVIVDRLSAGGADAPWQRAADVSQYISHSDGGVQS